MLRRRDFIRTSALSAGTLAFGPAFWRTALAQAPATPGTGPYGPLGPTDANGLALPAGFSSRVIAFYGQPVGSTGYIWPLFPDGSATYAQPDGGFVLVVNSEVPEGAGGASSISFDRDGNITGARRILGDTSGNCAGGSTPWGTWLSCEEVDDPGGLVWECDPLGVKPAVARPAMGRFSHEAACVDPIGKRVYLTEDTGDSGFYRFTPASYPSLSEGVLEIATPGSDGRVNWAVVPDPSSQSAPARKQVPGYTQFRRGEGIFFDTGVVYVATTSDDRIYAYDTATERLDVLYDGKATPNAPMHDVDNITVHPSSGDLFVCEDADNLEIGILTADREMAPFLRLDSALLAGFGGTDAQSETTGVTFDPAGKRLFFSSQRAFVGGVTFEITGPFRTLDPRRPPRVAAPSAPAVTRALRVRAPLSLRLATLRAKGLPVRLDADRTGTYSVRLVVAGRTIARTSRKLGAGRSASFRLRATRRALRDARGKRIRATLVVTQGRRRHTRTVTLTRGG